MHDHYMRAVAGFMSGIYRRYGSDVLEEIGRDVYETVSINRLVEAYSKADFRGRVEMQAQSLRGHLQPLTLVEDDEKVTLTMQPCGAGQRMLEEGAYDGPPYNLATVEDPHAITWGKSHFLIYCIHAPILEMLSMERVGHPLFVFHPAEKVATKSYSFSIYKDSKDIPEEIYTRVGKQAQKDQ